MDSFGSAPVNPAKILVSPLQTNGFSTTSTASSVGGGAPAAVTPATRNVTLLPETSPVAVSSQVVPAWSGSHCHRIGSSPLTSASPERRPRPGAT